MTKLGKFVAKMGITTYEVGAATYQTDGLRRLRSGTECGVFCIKMRLRNGDLVWMKRPSYGCSFVTH